MASQIGGFVHLFAVSEYGEHEPQVFRMRHDQSLRKLLRAYMAFRQFPKGSMAEIEAGLRLSAPDRAIGFLDPAATAGTCGLVDGDRVVVQGAPRTPVPQPAMAAPAPAPAPAAPAPMRQEASAAAAAMPPPPAPPARRQAAEAPRAPAAPEEEEPLPSLMATQAEAPIPRRARRASQGGGGGGRGRKAREEEAAGQVEFDEGPVVAGGDVAMGGADAAADWVELTPREAPREDGHRGRTAGRGRGRGKAGGAGWTLVEATQRGRRGRTQDGAATQVRRGRAAASSRVKSKAKTTRSGEPNVPRKNMKSINVTSGPAKGWQVIAWLKDAKKGGKKSGHTVSWRVRSPHRSRAYNNFSSSAGKANLREEVSEAIYDQIYRTVRPELQKQMNDRKAVLEGVKFSAPKRTAAVAAAGAAVAAPAAPKHRKKDPVTPVRPAEPAEPAALLATQCFFTPAKERQTQEPWPYGCDARLRRHARCIGSGPGQPLLVHLRERTAVGRCETNDLVLESRLTPQMISRCHAELVRDKAVDVFRIYDKKSTNGVLVNGKTATEGQALVEGDILTFGVKTLHPEFDYIFETRAGAGCPDEPRASASDDEAWQHPPPEPQEQAGAGEMEVDAEAPAAEGAAAGNQEAVAEVVSAEELADLKAARKMDKMDVDGKTAEEEKEEAAAGEEDGAKGGVILPEGKAGEAQGQGEEDFDGEAYDEEEEDAKDGKDADKKGADCKVEAEVKEEMDAEPEEAEVAKDGGADAERAEPEAEAAKELEEQAPSAE